MNKERSAAKHTTDNNDTIAAAEDRAKYIRVP